MENDTPNGGLAKEEMERVMVLLGRLDAQLDGLEAKIVRLETKGATA